jgi:hypothetical protein
MLATSFQQIGKSIGTGLGSKLEPEKKRQKPKPDGYNTRTPPPYYQTKGNPPPFLLQLTND